LVAGVFPEWAVIKWGLSGRDLIDGNDNDPLDQLKTLLSETIDIVWENQELVHLMYHETAALDKESLSTVLGEESRYVQYVETILVRARKSYSKHPYGGCEYYCLSSGIYCLEEMEF
jgi:hypothetical protein